MESETTQTAIMQATGAGLGSMFTPFVMDSIAAMLPWFMAMFAIIICDLVSGVAWRFKSGIRVRFSKAARDTMWKMSVYFFCVVAFCIIDKALVGDYNVNQWVCLIVCVIEGCSIISNILKWHGYNINFNKVIGIVLNKKYDVAIEDGEQIIEKRGRK